MVNIQRYLSRYYNEGTSCHILHLAEVDKKGSEIIERDGLLIEYNSKGKITDILHYEELPLNDLLYILKKHNIEFPKIELLPIYKLKTIKSKCIIYVKEPDGFSYFKF